MKKFLPLIILLFGVGIFLAVYFLIIKKPAVVSEEEASSQIEVALEDRPVVSLTPSADGHWLKLKIDKIIIDAQSLDYELIYDLPDGRSQGVPGTVAISGQKKIERDLLLGSESSGKFRYDEGVKEGTLTIRFRNDKGKLLVKFMTKFHLQSGTKSLTSIDQAFTFDMGKIALKTFFVTMETFGIPSSAPGEVAKGPYGVFSSSTSSIAGSVDIGLSAIYRATSSGWDKLVDSKSTDVGIFIGLK